MTMLLSRQQARGDARPARSLQPVPASPSVQLIIDPAAVGANTRLFSARTRGAVMAVVRADGFGHGAALVAALLDGNFRAVALQIVVYAHDRALR